MPEETPSDVGVSPEALATPTRMDNLAEKIYAAVAPVFVGEEVVDIIGALVLV